jgi:hypothetical protein
MSGTPLKANEVRGVALLFALITLPAASPGPY